MQVQHALNPIQPSAGEDVASGADLITEPLIERLVHAFYVEIRADPVLGPIFGPVIGADWAPHIERMCAFWSSVMLTSGRYSGSPVQAHMRLMSVAPEHFQRWLKLFRATATTVCAPDIAARFISRAERIADSLQLAMFHEIPDSSSAKPSLGGRIRLVARRR